jgi:phosphoribosylanthranilate isomerase
MSRVRVKFCGITSAVDAEAAIAAGADALGFVFYAASPRSVTPSTAAQIIRALPPFVTSVGLFVNASAEEVEHTIAATAIDRVQYHGDEPASLCRQISRPWIKAIRVGVNRDVSAAVERYAEASALLFDTYDAHLYGGSGRVFDWQLLPADMPMPFILAGGLTPDNVARAIRDTRPYGVDVSGGIEASKGVKDNQKMERFITEVKRLERTT